MTFNSAALHAASFSETTIGEGACLIGFSGATFFPLFTGRAGGGITRRRSSTTGVFAGAVIVLTLTVWDFSSTVNVVFEGNGRPGFFFTAFAGAFFAATFLASAFFGGAFLATFFAGAFLTAFLAAFFTDFLTGFFGTPRTLCGLTHEYQLRHEESYV
jgi:hypothetical protein